MDKPHTDKEPMKGPQAVTIIVAVLITASMVLYFFTFQVRVNECAVVTTFNRPVHSISSPGLYWKWPYPFQKVHTYDTRLQTFVSRVEQLLTLDDKSIVVQTYVGWRVDDADKFLRRVGRIEEVAEKLEDQIRTNTNGVISSYAFSQLVSTKNLDKDVFAEIEDEIKSLINDGEGGAKEYLGIIVEEFGIRTLKLPQKTTEKVFDRMKAEQNRLAESLRSDGEAEYQKIKSKAESEKEKILIEATAEAKKKRGKANAIAAEYYKVFAQDRDLAIWLRKLEALEKTLGRNTTLLLDPNTAPYDLLQQMNPKRMDKKKRDEGGE